MLVVALVLVIREMTYRAAGNHPLYQQAVVSPSSIASRLAAANLAWNPSKPSRSRHFRRVSDTSKPITRFSAATSPKAASPDKEEADLHALLQLISPKSRPAPAVVKNKEVLGVGSKQEHRYIGTPRIYTNQVFRDVYDSQGHHDKELFIEDFSTLQEKAGEKCTETALELIRKQRAYRRHSTSEAVSPS